MNTLSIYTHSLLLFFISLTTPIFGQGSISTQRLDTYFQEVKQHSPAPGFSVVVVKEREIIFSKGYGLAHADQNIPMTSQTVSAIGSLTKSFTSLAIMQLVEQGKVKLDTPITTYLPKFKTANSERSQKITVRMLLNNTSGIYGGVSQKWQDVDHSLDQLMHSLDAFYLKKEPGTSYEYSNAAFSLAGLIIQRVSGLSYPQYIKQHILDPLEMKQSSTDPALFEQLKAIEGHNMGIKRGIPANSGFDSYEMIPAGSMFRSSASDLGNYLIAMLNDGHYKGRQIISSKSLKKLWEPQISFPGLTVEMGGDGKDFHYGLGWMISDVENRVLIHHGGSTGTMSSMTVLYPEKKLAASILFNVDYNFLDPYSYPSEFSIINNLFHLLENEPLSSFGNPVVKDPTINQYSLPTTLQNRYIGTYLFNGKGDQRNYSGTKLVIKLNAANQLIGQVLRRERLLSEFELDFVHEGLAIRRNIGTPLEIRFKTQPTGKIDGLYLANSGFRKLPEDYYAQFQWITFKNKEYGFYLPKDWQVQYRDDGYISAKKYNSNAHILAGHLPNQVNSLETFSAQFLPTHTITYTGRKHTEIRGKQVWESQSFTTKKGMQNFQHLVMKNKGTHFLLILTTPFGELTTEILSSFSEL